MGQVDNEELLKILDNGNESWTGEQILHRLNKAGYYIVEIPLVRIVPRGICPACNGTYVKGQMVEI